MPRGRWNEFKNRGGGVGGRRGKGRSRGRGGREYRPHGKHQEGRNVDRVEDVLNYLKQPLRVPQTAVNIARGCGYHAASAVNPTLYSLHRKGILDQEIGPPPLWSLSPNYEGTEDLDMNQRTPQMITDMGSMGQADDPRINVGHGHMNVSQYSEGAAQSLPVKMEERGTGFCLDNEALNAVGHGDAEYADNGDEEEMEEEDEDFDINDRINDLMVFSGSNVLDLSAPSPGGADTQSQEEEEEPEKNWGPNPMSTNDSKPVKREIEANIEDEVALHGSPMSTGSPKTDNTFQNLCFRDQVLKTLASRLLKTGASFVIVNVLNSKKEEVEDALRDLEKDKLVSLSGSAWTVTKKGDAYLEENKICVPAQVIVPNVRRGDQNVYHPSKQGFGRGVPLSPLELIGSDTKFGVTGRGRGAVIAKIAQDIKKVTHPEINQSQISLTNLSSDSVIRRQGHGQTHEHGLITRPWIQETYQQDQTMNNQTLGHRQPFGSASMPNIYATQSAFGQGQALPMRNQMSGLPGPSSRSGSIPISPLEIIQRERMQSVSPQSLGYINQTSTSQMIDFSPGPQSLPVHPQGGASSLTASSSLNSLSSGSLQITTETFAGVNKNPVSALMEYAQSRATTARIDVISQRGPSHKPKFVIAAFVGNRQFPAVECGNKKDGKKEAADVAMRILLAEAQKSGNTSLNEKTLVPASAMTHFDKIAALTHQAFNQLIASIPEAMSGRKIIAGLVMKRNPDDLGIVISIGSGNRCITGQQLSLEGNTINDCHAEIITRRGFIRFLYRQLKSYQPGTPHELFELGKSGKLQIKPCITLHLYISTAPCGDGALFSPRDAESNKGPASLDRQHHPTFTNAVQGLLRTKMEGGEGTIPVESDFVAQTFDGIQRGERLRTMSCTDKICRWNVLGMQGALLSHFLEPIYLDSLTLGFLYDHGHLARAVCCRVDKCPPPINTQLPAGYHLNHPWLGRVTACDPPRETQKTKSLSVNWSLGDPRPEVLDGPLGLCYTPTEKTFFSRLTKKNLYDSFKTIATRFNRQDLLSADTYHKAKLMATDFQNAKAAMMKKLKENKYGQWVSKPVEEEMFC